MVEGVIEQREEELFSLQEVADFLGPRASTIRRQVWDGYLPAYSVVGEYAQHAEPDD